MTRPTALIVAIACVLAVAGSGCSTSWDAEYARGRQDGYRAAVDSVRAEHMQNDLRQGAR